MSEHVTLTADSILTHGDQQVSTVVDGETVLMNVGNGKYYRLDDIGSRVWELIGKPAAIGAVCDQLVQEFQVERATCEADVVALLDKLLRDDLINVVPHA